MRARRLSNRVSTRQVGPPARRSRKFSSGKCKPGMDLGIAGRRAIVCASTKGLGLAAAKALAGEGVNVVLNGRDRDHAQRMARALHAEFGAQAMGVGADLTTAEGRTCLLDACAAPHILVTNN